MEFGLEQNEYTIIDNTIIINWNIDKPIEPNQIDEKFNKLIFSNYLVPSISYEYSNNYIWYNQDMWIGSQFNKPINLAKKIICKSQISCVIFGDKFDNLVILKNDLAELNNLNQSTQLDQSTQLSRLKFGFNFNKPIELINSLTHLIFGISFNQPILLLEGLTNLEFGEEFNQPIIFPDSLINLTLGYDFNQYVELPNIKYLKIDCLEENESSIILMDNLPNSLEILILDWYFNLPLNNLPNSIKFLELPKYYDKPLENIPNSILTIKCSNNYKFKDNFIDSYISVILE